MRTPAIFVLVLALALVACGGDREERGLTPGTEQAVPADAREMDETGEERRKQLVEEMDEKSRERFDDAEDSP